MACEAAITRRALGRRRSVRGATARQAASDAPSRRRRRRRRRRVSMPRPKGTGMAIHHHPNGIAGEGQAFTPKTANRPPLCLSPSYVYHRPEAQTDRPFKGGYGGPAGMESKLSGSMIIGRAGGHGVSGNPSVGWGVACVDVCGCSDSELCGVPAPIIARERIGAGDRSLSNSITYCEQGQAGEGEAEPAKAKGEKERDNEGGGR